MRRRVDVSEYQDGRSTYKLIQETWAWVYTDLGLPNEPKKIAKAFVKPDGSYAYNS